MDKLAENHFTITKQLFMEGMLRISRDGYGRSARKAMLILLGLWSGFFLYTIAAKGSIAQALGFLVILAIAGLWLCAGMPRSHARRAWRTLVGQYGTNLQRTTCFYADHLEIQGQGVEKTIPYEDISEIKQSRRLLILVCRDKTGVLVALDGFIAGNGNEVKALIGSAENKE